MDAEILKVLQPIIIALISASTALLGVWLKSWLDRRQQRISDESKARTLLREAKNKWKEARRIKPETSSTSSEDKGEEQDRQGQFEDLMEECRDFLYEIADLKLSNERILKELYELASKTGHLDLIVLSGFRILRRKHPLRWRILQLPLPQWRILARQVFAWLRTSDDFPLRLVEFAGRNEALKYMPRILQNENHSVWEIIRTDGQAFAPAIKPREVDIGIKADV